MDLRPPLSLAVVGLLACEAPDKGGVGPGGAGDTASDTGGGDTGPDDTGSENRACVRTSLEVPLELDGAWLSPYNVRMAPDLDGGGRADVVVPYGEGTRGFAVYLGESVLLGEVERLAIGSISSEQAGHTVGVAGDLDADGLPELALGEARAVGSDPNGPQDVVVRWWSPARDAEIGRFLTRDATIVEGSWAVPVRPLPDLDGDGVPEAAVGAVEALRIFSGLGVAGTFGKEDATFVATDPSLSNGEATVRALPDGDGDGLGELLVLGTGAGLHVLTAATVRAGGSVAVPDLPLLARGGDAAAWGDGLDALLLDIDGDRREELFATWTDRLLGWRGADVEAALRGERDPLTADDAFVWAEADGGGRGEYLGVHLAAYSDGDCLPALAVSAHFASRVYLLDNDTLLEGGAVALDAARIFETSGWTGYGLGGGEDVDGDGWMDLVVGTWDESVGDEVSLLLGP